MSYKSNEDKIEELVRHINAVRENGILLGRRLMKAGEIELGRNLIANVQKHDQSKFSGFQWDHLWRENPSKDLLALAIADHNRTEAHHPEYWGTIHDMPRLYVAEMLCDWKARSNEMGTSVEQWVMEQAPAKFGFTHFDPISDTIMQLMGLLLDKKFVPVRPEKQT